MVLATVTGGFELYWMKSGGVFVLSLAGLLVVIGAIDWCLSGHSLSP